MKKYSVPLKFNWFFNLILFVLCCFVLSPLSLFVDFGSVSINRLEYNLPGFFELKIIGTACLFAVGVMAILIRKQVKYSLSGMGVVLIISTLTNLLHPELKYHDFGLALLTTLLISGLLFRKEFEKRNSISNKVLNSDG